MNGVQVAKQSAPAGFNPTRLRAAMDKPELRIVVDLNDGEAEWTAYSCDFSYGYVKINAEYHT
jgi:glutamate N-acetyltransferase/amino-acid N-acetyltransferase